MNAMTTPVERGGAAISTQSPPRSTDEHTSSLTFADERAGQTTHQQAADSSSITSADLMADVAEFGQQCATVTAPAAPEAVAMLRRETRSRFAQWDHDDETCYLMQLAIAELGANVIDHAPRPAGARMQVTWATDRQSATPCAMVSVLDAGDGTGRRGQDPDLPDNDDGLPLVSTGQRGLRMLLCSGVKIERLVLPESPAWPGGHLVSAWTPLDARARRRVCACPCWEHGYAAARCQQVVEGRRCRVRGFAGGSVACCRPCAAALRAAKLQSQFLEALRAVAVETRDAVTGLGTLARRLSGAVANARRVGVPVAQIAAALAGLGRGEDLLEIACADRDGSKLLWQLAALLAVPDELTEADASTVGARELLVVP